MDIATVEIIVRVHEHGGELTPDGDLLRYRGPTLTDELRTLIREHKPGLLAHLAVPIADPYDDPVACRGCATVIPAGTTLCIDCGSARSPLVRYAVQLVSETEHRTPRGQALVALDRRRYPKIDLDDGRTVGPGLVAWCPVLREMGTGELRELIRLVKQTDSRAVSEGDL